MTVRQSPRYWLSVLFFCCVLAPMTLTADELVAGNPHVYGPVGKTESLKSIATHIINGRDYKLRDIMAEIYYANPQAFAAGRSQILIPGALLKVPMHLAWNTKADTPVIKPPPAVAVTENLNPEPLQSMKKPATTDSSAGQASEQGQTSPAEVTLRQSTYLDKPPVVNNNPDMDENILLQVQMLKRELKAVNAALSASQEENRINARLQGAFYLMVFIVLGLFVTLLAVRAKSTARVTRADPNTADTDSSIQSRTLPEAEAGVTSHYPAAAANTVAPPQETAQDSDPELTPHSPAAAYDDVTPAAPMQAFDEPTPLNPSLAYQDNPVEPDHPVEEDVEEAEGNSDLHDFIVDISGRFKGMSDDREASNLALARVYLDLGDHEQARQLLTEARQSTNPEYARQATDMFHELERSEKFASSFHDIIDDFSDDGDSDINRQLDKLALEQTAANDDEQLSREYEMAQNSFKLGDYSRCKRHLATILGSGHPDLETQAYSLLKDIESIQSSSKYM